MDVQTSLNRIEELFRIMYLGLWVLWAETRWIAGPDIGYLALLEGDIVRLEKDREAHRAGHLAPLRARFGWLL